MTAATTRKPAATRRHIFFFIGVSTQGSSIMKVFPRWTELLGLEATIVGYDAPLHAPPPSYRRIVQRLRDDPYACGALITTHKIDLLNATGDLFDELDRYAELLGEVSCISKRQEKLLGSAKDPVSSGLALQEFLTPGYWARSGGQVLCLGAGGAAVAISTYLATRPDPADRPARFTAVDIDAERLEYLRELHDRLGNTLPLESVPGGDPRQVGELVSALPKRSLVINATGMGKDRPGSPVSDEAVFPEGGLVWELNYRGALDFYRQAMRQRQARQLHIEDGWRYFLHGWTQALAEVFGFELTPALFGRLEQLASAFRPTQHA